jgi:hypothetical protein
MLQSHKPEGVFRAAGKVAVSVGIIVALAFSCVRPNAQARWVAEAPGPNTDGQVEKIDDGEVAGAIKAVAAHPTDKDVVYVGAVNGGVWKTINATAKRPNWKPLTDDQKSLSIGALAFDPTDSASKTLVAGFGRFGSLGEFGGPRAGLLRTTDGGEHWDAIDGGGVLNGLNVSGVAPRGSAIVISVNAADDPAKVGVWRLTAADGRWRQLSGDATAQLPAGPSFCVVGDPSDSQRLYTNFGDKGIYTSPDAGGKWEKVSDPAVVDAQMADAGNVKIAVGAAGNVYVAVANSFPCSSLGTCSKLVGVFHTEDGGAHWAPMDLPATTDAGLNENGQAALHLSLAVDRSDGHVIYMGGESQLPSQGTDFPWNPNAPAGSPPQSPNSIGATNYTGILFRGDASKPTGSQWVHLTHSNTSGAAGGGTLTGSAPHADSRDMAVAPDGSLIEADDGGVYRRTSPLTNRGDWVSMNGDLQVTELHSVAYDHNVHIIIGGAQDTGTPQQQARSGVRWRSVSNMDGDGGGVAVDAASVAGHSIRYSGGADMRRNFRRFDYDLATGTVLEEYPKLDVIKGDPNLTSQFYTPFRLNAVDPTRMIIGARNGIYEASQRGDTLTEIDHGTMVNGADSGLAESYGSSAIAYGAAGKPDVLYVGSGNRVLVRKSAKSGLKQAGGYKGGDVLSIAVNPGDGAKAYVVDNRSVYEATKTGDKWNEVTGNLQTLAPGSLHSIAYSTGTTAGSIVVGADAGVFEAPGPKFSNWSRVGTGLPRAPVYYLEYNAADAVLVAATLGRGAWTLQAQPPPQQPQPPLALTGQGKQPRVKEPKARKSKKQAPDGPNTFLLRPGVVVDAADKRAYVMSVEGGIDAVDLNAGGKLWNNKASARPLTVAGRRLVSQAELSGAENSMKLVVLESATGAELTTGTKGLPQGVEASVVETLKGEFIAEAAPAGENAVVTWKFLERPLRGMLPARDRRAQEKATDLTLLKQTTGGDDATSGAFQLNLTTGATSAVADPNFLHSLEITASLRDEKRMADLPDGQVLSADGRHVLVSRPAGDAQAWERYIVTVYERDTRRRVGEFRTHFSVTSFFVSGSLIVFDTEAYVQTTPDGSTTEPLKLRAVDLATGKEVWSRPIRDTAYRGPSPP